MALRRGITTTVVMIATIVAMARPVRAQGQQEPLPIMAPADVRVLAGPLAVAPVLRLNDVGYDSNVLNNAADDNPQEDAVAVVSPEIDAWLRFSRARVSNRNEFDYYYFKERSDLRALDWESNVRLEVLLNRLTPYVSGDFASIRHRQSLEIDAIARRRNDGVVAGGNLRLTDKIFAGAFVRQSKLEYEPNQLYNGSDLGRELNHSSDGQGVSMRYKVTPFTSVGVDVERNQDRFDSAVERDTDSIFVTPSIELNPLALISGRASIGYRNSRFLNGKTPTFSGTVAQALLNYTLLGRTRFTVEFRRQLDYSYLVDQPDYLQTDVTLSVSQRLGDSWNIGGSVGRQHLSYSDVSASTNQSAPPDETGLTTSGELGYQVGHTRFGLRVEHSSRDTAGLEQSRGYKRLRIGTNLTYAF